jgi:phage FluMu protein Com
MGLNEIWLNKSCPKCKEPNWVFLKDYDEWQWDICTVDFEDFENGDIPEAIQCRACNHIFLMVEISEWIFNKTEDIFPEDWEEFDYEKIKEKIKVLIKIGGQTLQDFIDQLAVKQKGKKMVESK